MGFSLLSFGPSLTCCLPSQTRHLESPKLNWCSLPSNSFSPPQFFRCQPGHLPATTVSEARETLSCAQLGAHVPRNNPLWSTLTKSHTFNVLRDRLPSCPSFHSLPSKRAMSYVMANENLLQAHFSIIKHIKWQHIFWNSKRYILFSFSFDKSSVQGIVDQSSVSSNSTFEPALQPPPKPIIGKHEFQCLGTKPKQKIGPEGPF